MVATPTPSHHATTHVGAAAQDERPLLFSHGTLPCPPMFLISTGVPELLA